MFGNAANIIVDGLHQDRPPSSLPVYTLAAWKFAKADFEIGASSQPAARHLLALEVWGRQSKKTKERNHHGNAHHRSGVSRNILCTARAQTRREHHFLRCRAQKGFFSPQTRHS